MKLTEKFFARDAREVAEGLIGRELVRDVGGTRYRGTIIETAAYQGRSSRTQGGGIGYAPGKVYVMPHRGRLFLNIATEAKGVDSCVQIRRLQIGEEELGPMQLTQRLQIGESFDGKSIESYLLWMEGKRAPKSKILFVSPEEEKMSGNCLGYYRIMM